MSSSRPLRRSTAAALCLALALLLPFISGQIPRVGNALCLIHIPIFLAGFLCGAPWGLAVGFIAPLLRSFLFHAPPLYPRAIAMAFELATYGFVAGALYRSFKKTKRGCYAALVIAMLSGRVVWGIMRYLLDGLGGSEFPFSAFIAGGFLEAIPGIILHLIIIPVLVSALEKAMPETRPGF